MCFNDLHALAEHFEDSFAPQQPLPPMTAPLPTPAGQQVSSYYYLDATAVSATRQQPQFVACQGLHQDDMELNVDQSASSAPSSGALSPPDASTSTSPLSYPSTTPFVATYSVAPSPHASEPASPASLFDTTTVLPVPWHGPHRHSHHDPSHYPCCPARPDTTRGVPEDTFMLEDAFIPEDAVNAYTGYANDFGILPNTATNASLFTQRGVALTPVTGSQRVSNGHNNGSVAPTALLLSRTTSKTPNSTPPSSPIDSSISGGPCASACEQNSCVGSPSGGVDLSSNAQTLLGSTLGSQTARASATLSRSPFSPLLLSPFKRPKPNCNKSYKQTNGPKYHMTYGSCDSVPSEHFEHLMDVLASRPSVTAAAMGGESEVTLSDAELREVKKEAERRLRPYACGVGNCQKRYKNLNGLREYLVFHGGDGSMLMRANHSIPLRALG